MRRLKTHHVSAALFSVAFLGISATTLADDKDSEPESKDGLLWSFDAGG